MGFFSKLFGGSDDKAAQSANQVFAPVAGQCVPIQEVSDPTFGEEILGKGIAIRPTEGKVYAPCDAKVDLMFDTGHAVSLVSGFGAEILIHVGLETVGLKGEHFTIHTQTGADVKKGDLLIEFDLDAIAAKGFDTITPMVICNSGDYADIKTAVGQAVTNDDVVIELKK